MTEMRRSIIKDFSSTKFMLLSVSQSEIGEQVTVIHRLAVLTPFTR